MAHAKIQDEMWAIARARWEGEPRCSYSDLADFLGITKQSVGKRAARDHWQKKVNMAALVDKAHAAADRQIALSTAAPAKHKGAVDDRLHPGEWATPGSPAAAVIPRPVPDARNATPEMLAQAVEDVAVDARAHILARHRNEWPAARNQIYKSLKSSDNEGAKLAKLVSETLKLIQDGERKAWGLDAGETLPGQVKIVIERTEGVRAVR